MTNISNETNLIPPGTLAGYVPPMPTTTPGPADIQLALTAFAQRELAKQKWWRKSSNTVATALGGIITVAGVVVTTQTGLPQWAQLVVPILTVVGTIIGVKNTKNGFTMTGAAKIQQAMLDPVVLTTVQKVLATEPYPAHLAESGIALAAKEAQAWIDRTGNGQSQG